MTRAEAIEILKKLKPIPRRADGQSTTHLVITMALDMAINSLQVDEMYDLVMETYERLITRDDVLYAIKACGCLYHQGKTWYEEKELIQCFDDLYFKDKHIGGDTE